MANENCRGRARPCNGSSGNGSSGGGGSGSGGAMVAASTDYRITHRVRSRFVVFANRNSRKSVNAPDQPSTTHSIHEPTMRNRHPPQDLLRNVWGINQKLAATTANKQTDKQTDRQIDRQTNRQTDRQTDKQRDRQTDRQTDRQIDRQTN